MFTSEWFREQALLGNMYSACSAGAVTLSTVNTTCTGLSLSNPAGSGKLLVIQNVSFAPSTAPAGASVVGISIHTAISETNTTHTTPMVVHNAIAKGAAASTGKADAAATLQSTPLWLRPIGGVVAASSLSPGKYTENVNGDIIVPPGGCLSLSYLTTAAIGIAAISWVEIDE
jgi:hypothetical protein